MAGQLGKTDDGVVTLEGGTDATPIGNVGDRLKVTAAVTATVFPSWSSTLRYEDMNASTGGVARATVITDAAWVTVYSYTGSGYLANFLVTLETMSSWRIRLLVDGIDILDSTSGISTDDLQGDALYDLDDKADTNQANLGLTIGSHDRILFTPPLRFPMAYSTSVSVQIRRDTGAASKRFRAGLMVLSKVT